MAALLFSFALFTIAWLLHVIWWRITLPQNQNGALLLVFAAIPLIAAGFWAVGGMPPVVSIWELPAISAFYLGAVGCYLITYSGVEQVSPSLTIIRALESAGEKGGSVEELAVLITEDGFIRPRLDALKRDGMIVSADDGFVLTARGKLAARIALAFCRVFDIRENS